MPDPIHLDLTVSQVRGGVGLARMSDPLRLDLAVCQVQGGVGLAHMPDSKYLDLTSSPRRRGSNTHARPNTFGLDS
jgi:hypothetical protein